MLSAPNYTSGIHDELNERKLVIFRFVLTEIYPSENAIFLFNPVPLFIHLKTENLKHKFETLETQNYKYKKITNTTKVEFTFTNTTFYKYKEV